MARQVNSCTQTWNSVCQELRNFVGKPFWNFSYLYGKKRVGWKRLLQAITPIFFRTLSFFHLLPASLFSSLVMYIFSFSKLLFCIYFDSYVNTCFLINYIGIINMMGFKVILCKFKYFTIPVDLLHLLCLGLLASFWYLLLSEIIRLDS